jgi:uncharacterized protein YndB with AHSA1/START domain
MQSTIKSERPVTDAASKKDTGKTLKEWYAVLDAHGGAQQGRRNMRVFLYHEQKLPDWWAVTIAVEYERARGLKLKDGLAEGYGICVTKTLDADKDKVFAAWSDAKDLGQWFSPGIKAQVEDKGAYSDSNGNRGTYLRVRTDKDLRFTWENPAFSSASLVDVTFEDKGSGRTLLMVNHSRIQTRAEADGLRGAWGEALERLKAYVAK